MPLSNDGLRAYLAANPDPELETALAWTVAVTPASLTWCTAFRISFVREGLEMMRGEADIVVVSATPTEALNREGRSTTSRGMHASSPDRRWARRSSIWRCSSRQVSPAMS